MTTDNTSLKAKNYLIEKLSHIAESSASGIDGTTRIKAAVMAAYLAGRPVPAEGAPMLGFRRLEQEFGIRLTGASESS